MATIKVTFDPQHESSLFNFIEDEICHLREENKNNTANTYRSVLNSFKKFRKNEDIPFSCINPSIIESYEAWLTERGLASNTISNYVGTLCKVCNRAMDNGGIKYCCPFSDMDTIVKKSAKNVHPNDTSEKIKSRRQQLTGNTAVRSRHDKRTARFNLPASITASRLKSITIDFSSE